jgi:uncharacterized SAM-binding protein YcdF (DUF218 family)
MIDLDEHQIKAITEYMFLPDNPIKSDVTIVLGQTLWQRPFQKALELYKAGVSGKIVFTGGYNSKLGSYEALEMKKAWAQLGLPTEDILLDLQATNTMENMVNARALMQEAGLLHNPSKINLVSISYHMRRAVETLKSVFIDTPIELGFANYPSQLCVMDTWFLNPQGSKLLLEEFDKIKKYSLNCFEI